ncbi:MAG: MBL fold metallo-hydrolase, partial [Dehalococcoidia bacterium]
FSSTYLKVLSDGAIKYDGGTMFGQIPKVRWEEKASADRKNRVTMGLNCLLLQSCGRYILIETGVGSKVPDQVKEFHSLSTSKLFKELRDIGLTPKDIDVVILTHLHFDHAGGCTRVDRLGNIVTTFPKATHYIQRASWESATNPNERTREAYHSRDFLPLWERDQVALLDGDGEILPGIVARVTHGHTPGHQIILINHGGERVAFLGDLVPTPFHLELPYIAALDQFPEETLVKKREILEQAEQEGWLLVFAHGHNNARAGYLERRNGRAQLRLVEL